jgi:hypothetical protein
LLCLCCLVPAALAGGCAGFWDTVTSRDFKFKDLYARPEPLTVLKTSDDGTARAQALAALREPLQNGGSQQDQEAVLKLLSESAVGASAPLCRIAAMKALGRFKDPRAADVLCSVTEQNLSFTSEVNNWIRLEALKGLAETGQPVAVKRLVEVAKEPPAEGSSQDRQEVLERRLTAIRGLGKYNYPESNETLVYLLGHDKDVAIRDRAFGSLRSATGKDLPPNPDEWVAYLHPDPSRPNQPVARQPAPNGLWDYVTYPIRLVRGQ